MIIEKDITEQQLTEEEIADIDVIIQKNAKKMNFWSKVGNVTGWIVVFALLPIAIISYIWYIYQVWSIII